MYDKTNDEENVSSFLKSENGRFVLWNLYLKKL